MFGFRLNLNEMKIVKINSCVLRPPAILYGAEEGRRKITMSETKFFLNFRKFNIKNTNWYKTKMIKQKEAKMKKHIFGNFEMTFFGNTKTKRKEENEINATILIGTLFFT